MRSRSRSVLVVTGLAALVVLAACAPGANPLLGTAGARDQPAGFLMGFWHGAIVWVTFFVSLFNHGVSVYEVHNTGWPYNLGFLLGAAGSMGGGVAGSRRRRKG
jgi:hypothetical protein